MLSFFSLTSVNWWLILSRYGNSLCPRWCLKSRSSSSSVKRSQVWHFFSEYKLNCFLSTVVAPLCHDRKYHQYFQTFDYGFFFSGFGEIDQDDQINLIKQGSFEVMMCRFCNLVDYKKGTMFDPEMKIKCPRWLSYNVSSKKKKFHR